MKAMGEKGNKQTVLFCGQVIPEELFNQFYDELSTTTFPAANVFLNNVLAGLEQNRCEVYRTCYLPKKYLSKLKKDNIATVWVWRMQKNILFRRMAEVFGSFISVIKYNQQCKHKQKRVLFDVLSLYHAIGGLLACSLCKIPTVGIVTDMPGHRMHTDSQLCIRQKLYDRIGIKMVSMYDSYMLLSEEMKKSPALKNKESVVIEGLYKESIPFQKGAESGEKKVIVYAGSLFYQYGIMNLIDAVCQINQNDFVLKIYGAGEMVDKIISISKRDERIQYMGSVSHAEIVQIERDADLLVNPRPVDCDYVKYSFPSKNLEYMASGTPFIMTDIPSMPVEYKKYLFVVPNNHVESLKHAIEEILFGDHCEFYRKKAMYARTFILNEKNSKVQTEKLLRMMYGSLHSFQDAEK